MIGRKLALVREPNGLTTVDVERDGLDETKGA